MRGSRLETLSGSSSHTGGTVQARAGLVYSMVFTMYFTAFHCFYPFYPKERIAPVAFQSLSILKSNGSNLLQLL